MSSGGGRSTGHRLRAALVALSAVSLALCVAACTPDGQPPAPTGSAVSPPGPRTLTVAVSGPSPVVAAYTRVAESYSAAHPEVDVDVRRYASGQAELAAVRELTHEGNAPDLFLVDHEVLPEVLGTDAGAQPLNRPLNQPVDELLGARHLDFGDGYARVGLEAFSADSRLQCMPLELSPMVVYYNTDLVHLARLARPGEDPVTPETGWTMTDVARAARRASHGPARGIAVAPQIEQVAPFIWSGGGDVVDDEDQPTSTTLSGGASSAALEQLLEVVRNPHLTFSEEQLERRSALRRFEDGHLGMVLGFRGLTPQLRAAPGLHFDVMPIPRLPQRATIGAVRAMCISRDTRQVDTAADLLAHLVSDRAARTLAATGFVMPSNLDATNSPAFLQPGRQPAHAAVFDEAVRGIRFLPVGGSWPRARAVVDHALERLWVRPVIDPLDRRLEAVDRATQPILAPTPPPSPQSSASPAG